MKRFFMIFTVSVLSACSLGPGEKTYTACINQYPEPSGARLLDAFSNQGFIGGFFGTMAQQNSQEYQDWKSKMKSCEGQYAGELPPH